MIKRIILKLQDKLSFRSWCLNCTAFIPVTNLVWNLTPTLSRSFNLAIRPSEEWSSSRMLWYTLTPSSLTTRSQRTPPQMWHLPPMQTENKLVLSLVESSWAMHRSFGRVTSPRLVRTQSFSVWIWRPLLAWPLSLPTMPTSKRFISPLPSTWARFWLLWRPSRQPWLLATRTSWLSSLLRLSRLNMQRWLKAWRKQ